MNYFRISETGDAWRNLATDEYLLNTLGRDEIMLFLYVNKKAVIIGRNQNPLIECSLDNMDADGVQLVRRVSGGGAVYHDGGNLNYSFIAHKDIYDEKRQTSVIVKALESFGIVCEVSGRNDMTAEGRKFSGNAFAGRGEMRQHHGTLLISSDLSIFDRYLIPSKKKLEAKGVKSVRARVCNLSDFNPSLTVDAMAKALKAAFEAEYGSVSECPVTDAAAVNALYQKHSSFDWRIGETPHFDYVLEHKFPWGMVNLCFAVEGGCVKSAKLYTDSLDTGLSESTEKLLEGKLFRLESLCAALEGGNANQKELAALIKNERFIPD